MGVRGSRYERKRQGAYKVKKKTLVYSVGVALLLFYALSLLVAMFLSPKIDFHANKLAFAGTELILLDRGRVLSKDQWFPSYECLLKTCPESTQELRTPYMVALDHVRAEIIYAGLGAHACPRWWIYERVWRDGCIELGIQAYRLTPKELQLLLDFLQHPCRYDKAPITTSLQPFQCKDGVASKEREIVVFLSREPMSSTYPQPEKILLKSR